MVLRVPHGSSKLKGRKMKNIALFLILVGIWLFIILGVGMSHAQSAEEIRGLSQMISLAEEVEALRAENASLRKRIVLSVPAPEVVVQVVQVEVYHATPEKECGVICGTKERLNAFLR